MSFINTLENKLGRFAIPHSIRILALFQALVWLMVTVQPGFLEYILLTKEQVLRGEVWRLVTWVMYPGKIHFIFILFATMLLFMMGDALEAAWGAFRVNLFIFGGMLAVIIQVMFFAPSMASPHEVLKNYPADLMQVTMQMPMQAMWFNASILLAFACIAPNYEILLYMIIPMKVKWLGMITGALLLLDFLENSIVRLPILFSLLNFFVAFVPIFFKRMGQRAEVSSRRARFESAKTLDYEHFHKCHSCGKTDRDDPKMEFRVAADDHEYCANCRAKKSTVEV